MPAQMQIGRANVRYLNWAAGGQADGTHDRYRTRLPPRRPEWLRSTVTLLYPDYLVEPRGCYP